MDTVLLDLKARLSGGVSPAMATPLLGDSGEVALDIVPDLVDFLLSRGVKGLFVGGTTGEGILLSLAERRRLHEATVRAVDSRVPVLLHVGAMPAAAAVDLAVHAAAIGADAIAAVAPYFYGMHNDALLAFYKTLAQAAPQTPLFAYDIPHMAVNGIDPNLATALFRDIPSLAGVKSSNQDLRAVARLRRVVPSDRLLLAGNEAIALGALAFGADGMISGLSTAIPEPFVNLTAAVAAGDLAQARRTQTQIDRLLRELPPGARIGAIKAILMARGIPVGPPLSPLPAAEATLWAAMEPLLSE